MNEKKISLKKELFQAIVVVILCWLIVMQALKLVGRDKDPKVLEADYFKRLQMIK